MVSASRVPPSLPLHCAGPVSMVTGLSDRWPSHRYGILNCPTEPPPNYPRSSLDYIATRGRREPCALTTSISLFVHAHFCVRFPAAHLFKHRLPPPGPIHTRRTEPSWTHTYTQSSAEYCECASQVWNSGAGYSLEKRRHILSTSP